MDENQVLATVQEILVKARIKSTTGTEAEWAAADPILLDGEWGLIRGTLPLKFKIGDGSKNWSALEWGNVTIASAEADGLMSKYDKAKLDALLLDIDKYLYVVQYDKDTNTTTKEKAKAGYADNADNATKWDKHQFGDYLNQSVRTEDEVRFEQVTTPTVTTPDFVPGGFSGAGAGLVRYANGKTGLEVDDIYARHKIEVNEVIINQIAHVGGRTFYSAANIECVRVINGGTYWRCFFDTKNGQCTNLWKVGDQAYCQRYSADGTHLLSYYWRLVTSVGEDWINLSVSDSDGSGIPTEGDNIVQFGSRTDPKRQALLEIDQTNGGQVVQYAGINSFSIANRNEVAFGVNDQGKPFFYAYGSLFIGDRDLSNPDATFITFQTPEGETVPRMVASVDIRIGRGSSGLSNLSEWSSKQQQIDLAGKTASDAQTSANEAQAAANEAARATQAVNDYVQLLKSDVNAEIVAVNKRLDGVIETYFFPYDPTLENYPANEWTTDALKESHNGDRFNNTSTGNSWKWKIINSIWKWDEITDTFEKQLLNQIAKAQATADGKIRSFVFEPYPPYSVGDTWDQGPTGDSMRCIRSRVSGVFDASDWDKASKYTDDTVAKEAQAAASEAQSSAEKANNALADMANDLKFTPQEKAEMRDVYAQMELDYRSHQSNATTYGVSLTAVTSAYNNLRTYLADIAKINDKELTTTITAAQGITYDQYRSAWKTSVDNFANAISKKFVDDVKVGGVNLFRHYKEVWKANTGSATQNQSGTWTAIDAWVSSNNIPKLVSGKTYTFSILLKRISGENESGCSFYGITDDYVSLPNSHIVPTDRFEQYSVTIDNAIAGLTPHMYLPDGTIEVGGVQIEEGNKATYCSESPEDANDRISQAEDLLADIASDNKLTPSEKQSVKIEWETIVSEHQTLNEQAFRLSLLASDYETAFQGLKTYLTPLLESLATTSDINGPEFRALFNGYYTQSLNLRQQIQSVSTGEIRKVTIDATALDADKFYPVVFSLKQIVASRIRLYADLQDGDIPAWSTHPAGFSADVQWDSIGSGWGTIPVTRHVTSFAFSFAPNTPVGEIGQLEEATKEYIYVRGGGKYYAEATNTESIDFYPEGYLVSLNGTIYTIPIRDSITEPVVDVDYAKEAAEEAAKKLASWASDGMISPLEKTSLRQQQQDIQSEYAEITSNAGKYAVVTTAYAAAYNAANAALTKYTAAAPESIPVEADYADISAYYTARKTILGQISSATKAYADGALAALDGMARQLGYADYEALRTEAAKGATIISGGYVRTDLIDTDTLLARRLLVSDKTGKVSVLPESGLQLFKSEDNGATYVKTAEFRGEEKAGLGSVIPNYDTTSIRITEQIVTATTQSQTAIMAQGRVAGTAATPVVVTVPDIWITASLGGKLQVPKSSLPGSGIRPVFYKATLHVGLGFDGVNLGSDANTCMFNVASSQETSTHIIYELTGRDALYTFKVPASDRAVTNSAPGNVKVSFSYMWGDSNWPQGTVVDFQPRVCASFSPGMISSVTSQTLKVGSAVLLASFFGNGLIFSKSSNQYVGMMATPSGTQFEIRSGDTGVRLGADGISLRNSDGVWDNSGLLCGYRVDQDGTILTRFGVKDKPKNNCTRTSTGQYILSHNLGQEDYIVQITPAGWGRVFGLAYNAYANTVNIEFRSDTGAYADATFYVSIIGKY